MTARSTSIALALLFVAAGCDGDAEDLNDDFRSHSSQGKGKGKGHAKGKGHKHGHGHGHSHHNHDIYPDADWKVGNPAAHGLSAEGLEQMALVAEELNSSCMMVIHDGVLVGEWYWDGFERDTQVVNAFSTTKSVTSAVVGIAQDEGYFDIGDSAASYIDAWADSPSEDVTIQNLISNDSGRFWSFESDYITGLAPAQDQTAYAVGLSQQFEPGTMWEYNNAAIQTLEAVFESASGQDMAAYAQDKLFGPIGATAQMHPDLSGNALTYQGVTASCDDMARFGYLALRQGRWKGEQVVPKSWVEEATLPSTDLNDAYGYMWWLNREGHVVEPSFPGRVEYDGRLIPAASEELFMAVGAFGQMVAVDPVDEYVVIRLRNIPDPYEAMATDPDPVGINTIRALWTALEEAKL